MGTPDRPHCPAEDVLFAWSTGDASRWTRARLQRHVAGCAACRAQLHGWAVTTAAYRDHAPWPDPTADRVAAARFASRLEHEAVTPRSWRNTHVGPFSWRHAAAAVLLVGCVLLGIGPGERTVTADALVARAVAHERGVPRASADQVTIAATTGGAAGALVTTAAPRGATRVADSPDARELTRRLADFAFDWRTPLSPRPYQAWRRAFGAPSDHYDWFSADRIRISTHATRGPIARADLVLRAADLRPVAQTWQFADGLSVELRLADADTPPRTLAAVALPASASGEPATSAGIASAPRSLDDIEVALRLALERRGLLLTSTLRIRRTADAVRLDGRAPTTLLAALRRTAASSGARSDIVRTASLAVTATEPLPPALAAWLARTYGVGDGDTAFVTTAHVRHQELHDAALTLQGLAEHFPPTDDAANTRNAATRKAATDDDLHRLAALYRTRLIARYEALETHLAPLTGTIARPLPQAPLPAQWRHDVAATLEASRSLDAALRHLDAPTGDEASDASSFERIVGARLHAALMAVAPR